MYLTSLSKCISPRSALASWWCRRGSTAPCGPRPARRRRRFRDPPRDHPAPHRQRVGREAIAFQSAVARKRQELAATILGHGEPVKTSFPLWLRLPSDIRNAAVQFADAPGARRLRHPRRRLHGIARPRAGRRPRLPLQNPTKPDPSALLTLSSVLEADHAEASRSSRPDAPLEVEGAAAGKVHGVPIEPADDLAAAARQPLSSAGSVVLPRRSGGMERASDAPIRRPDLRAGLPWGRRRGRRSRSRHFPPRSRLRNRGLAP